MNGKYGLAIILTATVACLIVSEPQARAQGRCSAATLKGSYGVVEQGTIIADIGMPIPVPFPTANVAIVTYDGAGNLSATYTASYGGLILRGSVTGTYTVAPDCTYTDSVPTVHLERAGVITGEGMQQELRTIYTVPWIVGGGTRTKMTLGNCSVGDLKGVYLLASQGVLGPPDARLPLTNVGLITYNGRGNFYGEGTVNMGGTVVPNPFTGTYAVSANCAISSEVQDAIGTAHLAGVLVGQGANQEVRFLLTEPGTVVVGSVKRQ